MSSSTAQAEMINTALMLLGKEPVLDLSDASLAGSAAAVKLMRRIEASREVVLRRHGWTCALEYVQLSAAIIPGYSNFRYPTVFLLPGDAVRVWAIEGQVAAGPELNCWEPRWQVGTTEVAGGPQLVIRAAASMGDGWLGDGFGGDGWGGVTDTALSGLNVVYVRRADWGALDAHVADAVSYELAASSAYAVTGDLQVAAMLKKEVEPRISFAIGSDGTQEGGEPPPMASIPAALRNYSR